MKRIILIPCSAIEHQHHEVVINISMPIGMLSKVIRDAGYIPQTKSFDCGPNELFQIGCICWLFSMYSEKVSDYRRFRRHTFHLRLNTNILVTITHCYDITSFLFLYRHFPIKRWICMGLSLKNKRNTNRFLNCCFWIVPRGISYTVTKQFVLILQWQSPFELTFQSVNSFESIPHVKLKWPHSNNSS